MVEDISDDSKHTKNQLQQGGLVVSLRKMLPEFHQSLKPRKRRLPRHGGASAGPSPSTEAGESAIEIELQPIAHPSDLASPTKEAKPPFGDKEVSGSQRASMLVETTSDEQPLIVSGVQSSAPQASRLPQVVSPQKLQSLFYVAAEHPTIDRQTARGTMFHAYTCTEVLGKPWTEETVEGKGA